MDREQILADLKEWLMSDPNDSGVVYLDQALQKIDELEEEYE